MSILSRVVVCKGDVSRTLQHAMEIVGEDSHFVVYRGKSVSLAQRIRNERRVVDAFGKISLAGRKHDDMIEIKIACFENSHNLNTFGGLTMKRNSGGLHELQQEVL